MHFVGIFSIKRSRTRSGRREGEGRSAAGLELRNGLKKPKRKGQRSTVDLSIICFPERLKEFLESIYPIMSLDVRANTKAEIMGKFEMNVPPNFL